ncbi:MAG: SMI1/KNR4 family protein [Oscillospiraceae bacterium]|nr:SMI1/KNR4 family protein [Oscillospiraceae bacterium]
MDIKEFVHNKDVDFTKNLIGKSDIRAVEKELGVKIGSQLEEYLLEYGYLGFESVELYGVNSRQKLKSDMVTQTLYLHKYFRKTKPYIAIESFGDGDYRLVDPDDNVYRYISDGDDLTSTGKKLFDYILERFEEEM